MSSILKTEKKAVVLDTSALVAGFDPFSIREEQYTVPSVIEEALRNSVFSLRFETAIDSGKIIVKVPKAEFVEEIKVSASAVGDAFFLSETDRQVLALAFELKRNGYRALIATDDYSIQNVASQMKIDFASLITFGIRRRLHWIRYCPACHTKYQDYKGTKCRICGTILKRKPVKSNHVDR